MSSRMLRCSRLMISAAWLAGLPASRSSSRVDRAPFSARRPSRVPGDSMSSDVYSQSSDVNALDGDGDTPKIDVARLPDVDTVGERIEWALKQARIAAREASRRAGLGETQLGLVISRYRKNPNAEVTLPMLLNIARGLGVVDAWLLTGRGDPFVPAATFHSHVLLQERREWSELRRIAEQRAAERSRAVPAWAWDAAGQCAVPPSVRITASFVFDLACLCAEHAVIGSEPETTTENAGEEPDSKIRRVQRKEAI